MTLRLRPHAVRPRPRGRGRAVRGFRRPRVRAAVLSLLLATLPFAASARTSAADTGSGSGVPGGQGFDASPRPYLGWSSWSLQSSHYPGLNPYGNFSWLTEQHVLEQADVMAAKLRSHGYDYINIDAGWWMDWNWNEGYDAYGRQQVNTTRFPDGMAYVANYVHRKGLKLGIYMPVGLEKGAYRNGTTPIYGAPGCTTADVVYPDLRTTNGWDSSYAMNFANPCSQAYIDSLVKLFDSWGVDLLKLDGVGPGSGRGPGTSTPGVDGQYDNRADVAAWDRALASTHRHIELQLSWALNHDYVSDWQAHADSWRIDNDIECYCDTLVRWSLGGGVMSRFHDVLPWIDDAGPTTGWNNLDSLDVGNGQMDGLTQDERRSYATLWAISASPLYSGDDLTKLDDFGLSLLTNDEVIAIDQAGNPARPTAATRDQEQQVWYAKNPDGSYVVALFNLGDTTADVRATWSDLGFGGDASVRDVWSHTALGTFRDSFGATLPAHGSRLLTVKPHLGGA